MKRRKHLIPCLFAAGLLAAIAVPSVSAASAVQFEAVPVQTNISTGDSVTLSIRCTESDLSPASVSLVFQVPDNYVFSTAEAGSDISVGELSYSYQNGQLVLLYLDTAGGGSPVNPGQEIAAVTLQATAASDGEPLICTDVDSSAVDADGNIVGQTGSLEVGTVSVTGDTVALPAATPSVVEEGQAVDPETVRSTQVGLPAGSTTQPTSGDSAPVATPYFTTTPDGQQVQSMPDATTESADPKEESLPGQLAGTPVPTEMPPAAQKGVSLAWVWGAVVACVLVIVALILAMIRRKRKKS